MSIDWRAIPSLTALRAFSTVASQGGFSAAARMLNVTHAAVAQQVRGLEEDLGVALVIRQGRAIVLTPEGARLAATLVEGFGAIAAGISALRAEKGDGPVRVTLTATFAAQWLMPRLRDFWAKHPDIGLSLNPDSAVVDLRRTGMDLGIRYGKGNWPGVSAQFLTSARLIVAAAPSLIDGRTPMSVAALQAEEWILTGDWPEQDSFLKSIGLNPAALSFTEMSDEALVLAAAREGLGLVVESMALLQDDIRDGRLCVVHDSREALPAYFLVVPPGPIRAPAKTFLKWLAGI